MNQNQIKKMGLLIGAMLIAASNPILGADRNNAKERLRKKLEQQGKTVKSTDSSALVFDTYIAIKTQLFEALKGKKTAKIITLLNKFNKKIRKQIVNERFEHNITPLMAAAELGDLKTVTLLIDNEADIDARDVANNQAIDYAERHGWVDIVTYLLSKGACFSNINDKLREACLAKRYSTIPVILKQPGVNIEFKLNDTTLLLYAVAIQDAELARILLAHGANTEAVEPGYRQTSLIVAATEGSDTIVQLLLDHGANIDACDITGTCALHAAMCKGHKSTARILINANRINLNKQSRGAPFIYWAADWGHCDLIHLLHAKGAIIDNPAQPEGGTALMAAARKNQLDAAQTLCELGADTNAVHKFTPLALAARYGHIALAQLLIKNGAAVELPLAYNITALMQAALNGNSAMVAELLANNNTYSFVNAQTTDNCTALMACCLGSGDIVNTAQLLLEAGALPDIQDREGYTAFNIALMSALHFGIKSTQGNNLLQAAGLLAEYGADTTLANIPNGDLDADDDVAALLDRIDAKKSKIAQQRRKVQELRAQAGQGPDALMPQAKTLSGTLELLEQEQHILEQIIAQSCITTLHELQELCGSEQLKLTEDVTAIPFDAICQQMAQQAQELSATLERMNTAAPAATVASEDTESTDSAESAIDAGASADIIEPVDMKKLIAEQKALKKQSIDVAAGAASPELAAPAVKSKKHKIKQPKISGDTLIAAVAKLRTIISVTQDGTRHTCLETDTGTVPVPRHGKRPIKPGTLHGILAKLKVSLSELDSVL